MQVRAAGTDRHAEILSILDAAALQTDSEQTREAIKRESVFVAIADRRGGETDPEPPPVLGALVLDDSEITAVAVRPGRRGQGIGRALVARAQRSRNRLVAEFDPGVRPFWEAVGFTVSEQSEDRRLSGVWQGE